MGGVGKHTATHREARRSESQGVKDREVRRSESSTRDTVSLAMKKASMAWQVGRGGVKGFMLRRVMDGEGEGRVECVGWGGGGAL